MSAASSSVTFRIRSGGDSDCPTAVNGKQNTPRGSPIAPSIRMPFECITGVNNPGNVALALMAGARCPVDMHFVLKEAKSKAVPSSHFCWVGDTSTRKYKGKSYVNSSIRLHHKANIPIRNLAKS